MTKGKHGAESARRRAEAAHEHIDRLTDQLVEAKERARRFEQTALRVPGLEAEITRLRTDVEAQDGPHQRRAEALSRELHEFRQDTAADIDRIRFFYRRFARAAGDRWRMTPDEVNEIAELLRVKVADLVADVDGKPRSFRHGRRRINQTALEDLMSDMRNKAHAHSGNVSFKEVAEEVWVSLDKLFEDDPFPDEEFIDWVRTIRNILVFPEGDE